MSLIRFVLMILVNLRRAFVLDLVPPIHLLVIFQIKKKTSIIDVARFSDVVYFQSLKNLAASMNDKGEYFTPSMVFDPNTPPLAGISIPTYTPQPVECFSVK
jgi:hypothetical protein